MTHSHNLAHTQHRHRAAEKQAKWWRQDQQRKAEREAKTMAMKAKHMAEELER